MKKYHRIIKHTFVCLVLLVVALVPGFVSADTTIKKDERNTCRMADEKKIPELQEEMVLYRGNSIYLDFPKGCSVSDVRMESENPEIVEVSETGKLTAKKCGTATVRACLTEDDMDIAVRISVSVKYNSFQKMESFGRPLLKESGKKTEAVLNYHRNMEAGESSGITFQNIRKDMVLEYSSLDPQVAAVSEDGIITAKKAGTAKIKICLKQKKSECCLYETVYVNKPGEQKYKISDKTRDEWFSNAGFVGNSIGVGLKAYFDSQGEDFLGKPVMMVKGCYSFANDESETDQYKVDYNGKTDRARRVIRRSGVKKVFINMGTNDLWESPQAAYKRYLVYLEGIRQDNPDVEIFIESTTPVVCGHESERLSNRNIEILNNLIRKHCEKEKGMYYIDINTCLKDGDDCLDPAYSSDKFVHLNSKGYERWTKVLCDYVDEMLIQQIQIEDAIKTAEESGIEKDYRKAREMLDSMQESTWKDEMDDRLKNVIRSK